MGSEMKHKSLSFSVFFYDSMTKIYCISPLFSYTCIILLCLLHKYYENSGAHGFFALYYHLQGQHLLNFLYRRSSRWLFITLQIAAILLSANAHADNILAKEYFLKAAFLYNFSRLVEWPAATFTNNYEPFQLCFIGEEPFAEALESIRNKKINGRPLIIQHNISLSYASQCQILFISQSEKQNIAQILTVLNQASVLTVSELPDFAEQQGHIRFFLNDDEKLRLEVNLEAIKQAGLKISSRILSLAKIVSSKRIIKP